MKEYAKEVFVTIKYIFPNNIYDQIQQNGITALVWLQTDQFCK